MIIEWSHSTPNLWFLYIDRQMVAPEVRRYGAGRYEVWRYTIDGAKYLSGPFNTLEAAKTAALLFV